MTAFTDRTAAPDSEFAEVLAAIEAAPAAYEALRERVARAMRSTRECQAGMAFGVPPDARESFMHALADAAIAVMRGDQ